MDEINNNNLPDGFEYYYNSLTKRMSIRPVKGYSEKYYDKERYLPKKAEEYSTVSDSKNSSLHKAKQEKNDEFYTRLTDIVNELKHYKEHFVGKVIYCPCDKLFNEGQSNFGKYFVSNFHKLGVKKLICTLFNPNGNGVVKEYDFERCGLKWEYNGEKEDGEFDESDIDIYFLKGNGSFDSEECKEIMRNCDIVVTNPPFSLFRKFVKQIIDMDKKFLIIGNQNAITYKEIFNYIKENKLWLGYSTNKTFAFETAYTNNNDNNKKSLERMGLDPSKYILVKGISWFTNLEHNKRKEFIALAKKYNEDNYPKYDNYDAIEVSKVSEIPKDYDGVMGVPITFLGKYNPEQFKIIKFRKGDDEKDLAINGKTPYFRILIQKINKL